ncbi:translation initiation factor IF-2-like [Strigops habroptila]|uniref:translation initiation factor IF-2-like n=1 Tax=Strigops habroptila TaxID=2489341 RepID=UPI0011CF2A85|nr:translation initiation factor IF-2-like [Strigops habroptila]
MTAAQRRPAAAPGPACAPPVAPSAEERGAVQRGGRRALGRRRSSGHTTQPIGGGGAGPSLQRPAGRKPGRGLLLPLRVGGPRVRDLELPEPVLFSVPQPSLWPACAPHPKSPESSQCRPASITPQSPRRSPGRKQRQEGRGVASSPTASPRSGSIPGDASSASGRAGPLSGL